MQVSTNLNHSPPRTSYEHRVTSVTAAPAACMVPSWLESDAEKLKRKNYIQVLGLDHNPDTLWTRLCELPCRATTKVPNFPAFTLGLVTFAALEGLTLGIALGVLFPLSSRQIYRYDVAWCNANLASMSLMQCLAYVKKPTVAYDDHQSGTYQICDPRLGHTSECASFFEPLGASIGGAMLLAFGSIVAVAVGAGVVWGHMHYSRRRMTGISGAPTSPV